jgi:hypothetical protein
MATVTRASPQIADPARPNRKKENRRLPRLEDGTRVLLVETASHGSTTYWQVFSAGWSHGPLGWLPEERDGDAVLEPFQPECPASSSVTDADLAPLTSLERLTCFGDEEITLTGTVACTRMTSDFSVGGASFLDANRACDLGGHEGVRLYGDVITSLLETPPVESLVGQFVMTGQFDHPDARVCHTIPFGASAPNTPSRPPHPGAVTTCRQLFVVSAVTRVT